MANFTAADVKRIRDLTGAGMMDCKSALTEADGDFDKAVEILRIKGAKDVGKRAGRSTANGLVAHSGTALLELNCETDFVAKNADFVALGRRLVEYVATHRPADVAALLTRVVADATADGLMSRAGRSSGADGSDKPEAVVGADQPLAEWEQELMISGSPTESEAAPQQAESTTSNGVLHT